MVGLEPSGECQARHALALQIPASEATSSSCTFITNIGKAFGASTISVCTPGPTSTPAIIFMCTSKFFKGASCDHTWTEIITPCAEGKGFGNCSSFSDGKIRRKSELRRSTAPEKSCPTCDKKGDYDGNKIRTIRSTTYGGVWGCNGASKSAPGLHCIFARQKKFPKKRPEPEINICCVVM